jgi:threonine dehydrogenase-like Zn-dependent dehydrogenase
MRAMVFTAPGAVEMLDVPDAVAGDDEVIVHVERAGICGSELHGIQTPGFRFPPLIMGHEFVGRTPDGRRVAVNPLVSCSTCDRCRAGLAHLCRTRSLVGVHRAGGFAERVAVPRTALHELPDDIDWDRAALIEPLANAIHAWTLAGAPAGAAVGVIGCGPIGLCCVEIARHRGAASVAGADLSAERRAVASSLGAETSSALDGEYDVIFDAVGTAATRAMSLERLIPGGTAVWLGLATPDVGFDAAAAVRFEKGVRGSFAYSDEEFDAATHVAARLDLSWTTTYPLEEGASVFTDLMRGRSTPVKALLQPT